MFLHTVLKCMFINNSTVSYCKYGNGHHKGFSMKKHTVPYWEGSSSCITVHMYIYGILPVSVSKSIVYYIFFSYKEDILKRLFHRWLHILCVGASAMDVSMGPCSVCFILKQERRVDSLGELAKVTLILCCDFVHGLMCKSFALSK